MISVHNLSIFFSGIPLFKDLQFVIGDHERVGLVGKNGVGKTTLLRIIAHEIEPESGEMVITKDFRIGYLPQEMKIESKKTVWEKAGEAFEEIRRIDAEIEQLNHLLSEQKSYYADSYSHWINQLQHLNDRRQYLGANRMNQDMELVLTGLGFSQNDFNRPVSQFSSGWQMRIELAKILLRRTEIILLDEPTNHLDIESIQWLEHFLQHYQGCLIMVSHDRQFLNNSCQRTLEITLGHIEDYKCNYNTYVERRQERIAHQQKIFDNQQKEINDIEKFIERFRYKATKAKQVQSRIKMLEKMDRMQVDELDTSQIHFLFPPAPKCNRVVFEAVALSQAYETGKNVLENINAVIENKEKVAFIGKNGEGKSTMMKLLMGELQPNAGKLHVGDMVKIGYYAQNQNQKLDPTRTVFQTLDDIAVGEVRTKVRGILGSFLFDSDDLEKKVSVLSGGEKARLALAKLLLEPYNVLLLDEPTNHLDMTSKDVLKNALLRYDGTLVIVSHDRDFLQGLTDKVFEFSHKQVRLHLGDIQEYLEERQKCWAKPDNNQTDNSGPNNSVPTDSKNSWEEQKRKDSLIRKTERQIEQIEQSIQNKEKEMADCNEQLSQPNTDSAQMNSLYKNYQQLQEELEALMTAWEELSLELDRLR